MGTSNSYLKMNRLINNISQSLSLKKDHIENIIKLLEDGATIPFIARYRKELTGGADDEQLREFERLYTKERNLLAKKEDIKHLIAERADLTTELTRAIESAESMRELEDIFRPYKEKKNTRAGVAIEAGLSPLASLLRGAGVTRSELLSHAKKFTSQTFPSPQDAINGAKDILAAEFADDAKERDILRNHMMKSAVLVIKKGKEFNEKGLYAHFAGKSERIAQIPSHRYLAIMRGNNEKELSVTIDVSLERTHENIARFKIPKEAKDSKVLLLEAYKEGLERLLIPSLEREIHAWLKERSDAVAINTFGKNLSQLLLTPPVTSKVLMGVDPGYVSGCKIAIIDERGKFLDHGVIYPTKPKADYEGAKRVVMSLTKRYNVSGIVIGNGTASRETQEFFAKLNQEMPAKIPYTVVSESGASVYSASKLAHEEYPQLDVTVRGAISIAARVLDPMATYVKIDPKSLGIGQYQHDVDQKLLAKRLHDVTTDLVNRVGVDINSASASLLEYVAGIGAKLAQSIVAFRDEQGAFRTKEELLKVKGLGKKAYEQAAGFIRIKNSSDPLQNSGIHPESFKAARALLACDLSTIEIASKAKELGIGEATLKDIIFELQKPGFDPRSSLEPIPFKESLLDISMLSIGSFVSGVVRNITDFGAFVDIGLKNDGLIHISKLSASRISHPLEVLGVNDYLPKIEVISIDREKNKIGLSLI